MAYERDAKCAMLGCNNKRYNGRVQKDRKTIYCYAHFTGYANVKNDVDQVRLRG